MTVTANLQDADRLDVATARARARGSWDQILPVLGIQVPPHPMKHGPCPCCGGKDRFRFDDKDGTGSWYCNQCNPHAGDGFALVMKVKGGISGPHSAPSTISSATPIVALIGHGTKPPPELIGHGNTGKAPSAKVKLYQPISSRVDS